MFKAAVNSDDHLIRPLNQSINDHLFIDDAILHVPWILFVFVVNMCTLAR